MVASTPLRRATAQQVSARSLQSTRIQCRVATAWTVVLAALIAGVFPLDILGELISVGILLAFTVVCVGVLVLRYKRPDIERPFRAPFAPLTCTLGAAISLALIVSLWNETWLRLVVWTILGYSIYAAYGYRHSRLRHERPSANGGR